MSIVYRIFFFVTLALLFLASTGFANPDKPV